MSDKNFALREKLYNDHWLNEIDVLGRYFFFTRINDLSITFQGK